MKNTVFAISFFIFTCSVTSYSFSQANNTVSIPSLPLLANKVVYNASVVLDTGFNKEKLFDNAQQWYKANFESADNTLFIYKPDSGKLSGTGIIHAKKHENRIDPEDIFFTIDIAVQKGKWDYKIYEIYGFEKAGKFYYSDMYNEAIYPPAKSKWNAEYKITMINNMDEKIKAMLGTLNLFMAKK